MDNRWGLALFYHRGRLTVSYVALFVLLLVFSRIYGFCVFLLRTFYRRGFIRRYRPRSRVISIGNITLGGSGKTPLVHYVVSRLRERDRNVAVFLRGYGRPCAGEKRRHADYQLLGDEGSMLREMFDEQVMVRAGRDRVAAARRLEEEGFAGVMVLDDGFQHWRFARDLDIVTLDASRPFGNGMLLPAGHLREGAGALRRAHVLCLTRCDQALEDALLRLEKRLADICPGVPVIRTVHEPCALYDLRKKTHPDAASLRDRPVALVCGIGHPASFEKTVLSAGARIVSKTIFADHHPYGGDDLRRVSQSARSAGARLIVTTQKDAQRLKGLVGQMDPHLDVFVLCVRIKITKGEEEFLARLRSVSSL